jgi:hypothetical protein
VTVPSNSGACDPVTGWEKLGFDGDPVPGDPRVLQGVVDDFTFLRDVAWTVSQGLEAVAAAASSGGFEGETADALREVVSGRLKSFVYNIGRAFSLAEEAMAEYRLVLVQAQQVVGELVSQAAGSAAGDPKSGGLKQRVVDQLTRVRAAEVVMIRALEDASAMVSQPIKVPSLSDRIWKEVKEALSITATVLALASVVVDGPLGIAAAAAAAGTFGMTLTDYVRGRTSLLRLVSSIAGLLMPTTKGIWSLEELGSGLRGFLGAVGRVGGKSAGVLTSPSAAALLVRGGVGIWRGLARVPGLLLDGVRAVPRALRGLGPVIAENFAHVQKLYPELAGILSPYGAYVVVGLGRVAGALFTPMTIKDMAEFGFGGAWRQAWARASLTNAARAFSRGWTAKGLQATYAALNVWHMLRNWSLMPSRRGARPGWAGPATRSDHGPGPGPRPGAEPRPGPGGLGEPMPVIPWVERDLRHSGLTPTAGGLLVPPVLPVDRLGSTAPAGGERALPEMLFPPTSQIVLDKIEQDGAHGLLNTRSGLLVPVASVLSDQGRQLLREDPQIVEELASGKFEAVADLADTGMTDSGMAGNGMAGNGNGFAERPVQPADVQGVPQAHLEARQVLDLLNAETAAGAGDARAGDAGATTRRADRMAQPAPRYETHVVDPAASSVIMRVEEHEVDEQGQASDVSDVTGVAGWGSWPASVMRDFWKPLWQRIAATPNPQLPFRESLVHAKQLVAQARTAAHEGRDPRALLQQATKLRSTAYHGLLTDAELAVREFAHTPGHTPGDERRMIAGFQVNAVDGGGHAAVHVETGLQTEFNAQGSLVSREVHPLSTRSHIDELKITARYSGWWNGWSYELSRDTAPAFPFVVQTGDGQRTTPRHAFMITDLVKGDRYIFDTNGTLTLRDVWVGDPGEAQGLGYLRFDLSKPNSAAPALVNRAGTSVPQARVTMPGPGRVGLIPSGGPRLEQLVVDPHDGRLLSQTLATFDTDEQFTGRYWRINHESGQMAVIGGDGQPITEWRSVRIRGGEVRNADTDGVVFRRPALGSGQAAIPGSDTISPWLSRPGTFTFRQFGPGGYHLKLASGEGPRRAYVSLVDRRPRLVDLESHRGLDVRPEFGWSAQGLVLRVPVAGMPDAARAEYTFTENGDLIGLRWPLVGLSGDWEALGSLRVVATHDSSRWHYTLAGPPETANRFRIEAFADRAPTERIKSMLPREQRSGFTITKRNTDNRLYFGYGDVPSTPAAWEIQLSTRGELRLVGTPGVNPVNPVNPSVVDALCLPVSNYSASVLGDGLVFVRRTFHGLGRSGPRSGPILNKPMVLVRTTSLRVESPGPQDAVVEVNRVENGAMTLRFRVPGAPQWVMTDYRLAPGQRPEENIRLMHDPYMPGASLRPSPSGEGLRLVDQAGRVVEMPAEFVRSANGLTVRLPVDYAPSGVGAEYTFDSAGQLVRKEWPAGGIGSWEALGSLRVTEQRNGDGTWRYVLKGPRRTVARFRLVMHVEWNDRYYEYAITERKPLSGNLRTQLCYQHTIPGRPAALWMQLDDRTRLAMFFTPARGEEQLMVRESFSWGSERVSSMNLGDGRVLVHRAHEPVMLVHADTLRVETLRPHDAAPGDAETVTFTLRAPGAPDGVMATYRFDRHSMQLVGGDVPLIRGPEEAPVASLRLVMNYRYMDMALSGQASTRFRAGRTQWIDEQDTALDRYRWSGITVIEIPHSWKWEEVRRRFPVHTRLYPGVRRHYAIGGVLLFRDLPLGPREYLRVGTGPMADVLQVIDRRGRALRGWRVERLDDGLVAAVPTLWDHLLTRRRPLTRIVVDPGYGVVEEILGVRPKGAKLPAWYWKLNYRSRPPIAARMRPDGTEWDRLPLVRSADGLFSVVHEDQVLLDRSTWRVIAGAPLLPEKVVREVPLKGELTGMILRQVHGGTEPDAARRWEVVDLRDPDRSSGWTAAKDRFDHCGIVIADDTRDRHWYLNESGKILFWDVRLPGTERYVRFDTRGQAWLVEANGDAAVAEKGVVHEYVKPGVVDGTYALEPTFSPWPRVSQLRKLIRLTVRLTRETDETVWHFDGQRRLVSTSVTPRHRVTDVPLPGSELAGMRLRVIETGAGPETVRRVELIDLGPEDRTARTGWTATDRPFGGFIITDPGRDRRWYLDEANRIDYYDIRLENTRRYLRFRADGEPSVVEAGGRAVEGEYMIEPRAGGETGLTVRLHGHAHTRAAEGALTTWHFDAGHFDARQTPTGSRRRLR